MFPLVDRCIRSRRGESPRVFDRGAHIGRSCSFLVRH
jgi:hypothetical protein